MKTLIPMVLLGFMLAGCPDAKTPKAPPGAPEPKASKVDAAVSLAWAKMPDTPMRLHRVMQVLSSNRDRTCRLALIMGAVLLSACTAPGPMASKTADIGGQPYLVTPLTAGTWTVTTKAQGQPLPRTPAATAAMVKAVEAISGCKVTDSDYSRDGLQLDAQVDCAGLKS